MHGLAEIFLMQAANNAGSIRFAVIACDQIIRLALDP